jgi:dihydroorotase
LNGLHVLPGLIDDQVHFREPGLTHKATIASESLAAICGGVTSYLDMPNNAPPCVDRAGLAAKKAIAARASFANYGFYLGATNTNLDEIRAATPAEACGIKVFMGASTGNMLVDDERTLERIFADATLPIATHCEDTPLIRAAEARAREKYG